jgi:hypothetical protein
MSLAASVASVARLPGASRWRRASRARRSSISIFVTRRSCHGGIWAAPPTYSLGVVQFAWKFGVVMLVALALVVLPGGGNALDVALTLLTVAFFAAIAFLVYRLYRQYRFDLDALDSSLKLGLYGSLALAVLTFTATDRLFDAGGGGVLVWFALLAAASYGLFWVWTRYRRYE